MRTALPSALLLVALLAGCPRPPGAVLTPVSSAGDLAAVRDSFNADVEHRRVLVLLSPS